MEDEKAKIWDQRNMGEGEPYKKHITDPLIIELDQHLYGKVVLEQGCGNGHLARKLAKEKPEKIILLDLYESNLACARGNLDSVPGRFKYVQEDLNKPSGLESSSIDVVTSSMVLSEIENLHLVIQETYRLLRESGVYIFSVIHPAYVLKRYLKGKPKKNSASPKLL